MALTSKLMDGQTETERLYQEQLDLEREQMSWGAERYHRQRVDAEERGDAHGLIPVRRLCAHWFDPYVAAIQEEQDEIEDGVTIHGSGRAMTWSTLLYFPAETVATIAMHSILSNLLMAKDQELTLQSLCYRVGMSLRSEIESEIARTHPGEDVRKLWRRWMFYHETRRPKSWRKFARRTIPEDVDDNVRVVRWVGHVLVGLFQISASAAGYDEDELVPCIKVEKRYPRAYTRRSTNRMIRWVTLTDECLAVIEEGHKEREHLCPVRFPMLFEPRTWEIDIDSPTGFNEGGYCSIRLPFHSNMNKHRRRWMRENLVSWMTSRYLCEQSTPLGESLSVSMNES